MGYPYSVLPHNRTNLDTNIFCKKNLKYILMLSKPMNNMNIIIKFPNVSHLVCPCFIIAPTCTIVRGTTLMNNILCQIKLNHFINKYVFQTTLT